MRSGRTAIGLLALLLLAMAVAAGLWWRLGAGSDPVHDGDQPVVDGGREPGDGVLDRDPIPFGAREARLGEPIRGRQLSLPGGQRQELVDDANFVPLLGSRYLVGFGEDAREACVMLTDRTGEAGITASCIPADTGDDQGIFVAWEPPGGVPLLAIGYLPDDAVLAIAGDGEQFQVNEDGVFLFAGADLADGARVFDANGRELWSINAE